MRDDDKFIIAAMIGWFAPIWLIIVILLSEFLDVREHRRKFPTLDELDK